MTVAAEPGGGDIALACRQSLLAALARRAQNQQGLARELIEERIRQLQARPAPRPWALQAEDAIPPEFRAAAEPNPLGALLASLAPDSAQARDLQAVRLYRDDWAHLAAQLRLSQARAQVPSNAGPLNTQRLLHQALAVMAQSSPAYLGRFLAQAETLLWLEQLQQQSQAAPEKKNGAPQGALPKSVRK